MIICMIIYNRVSFVFDTCLTQQCPLDVGMVAFAIIPLSRPQHEVDGKEHSDITHVEVKTDGPSCL